MDSQEKLCNFLETDVICFSTQECCNSIIKSFLCSSKSKWQAKLDRVLVRTHIKAVDVSMNAMHTAVYVKKGLAINVDSEFIRHVYLQERHGDVWPDEKQGVYNNRA